MVSKTAFSRIGRELRDYFLILIGTNITALALIWFLVPNRIAAGGVSGLATIFYHLWSWPISLVILVVNIPMILVYLKIFGAGNGVKTFVGATFLSVAVEFWAKHAGGLTDDPFLAALFGGALAGVGMGLTFRYHGTTGGTDLAAKLVHRFTGLSIGKALYLFDGLVILLAGIVFGGPEAALYAVVALVATGRAIDLVLEGLNYAKAALIISDQAPRIGQRILDELQRGVTSLNGSGLYSGTAKEVLLCVIGRAEEIRLKELVRAEDPRAFMIFTDVREVLGEGFKQF